MSFESYPRPTSMREADRTIAAIERHQRILRQRGDYVGAEEWRTELAEQKEAREEIRQARESKFQSDIAAIARRR